MPLSKIPANGISAIANTAISGNIVSSQITSVSNTQISGNIISSQITSVANTQITGLIANTQIANVSNTKIVGLIIATQLANTAVTAGIYGGANNSASITVDAQGRVTSVSNVAITTGAPTPNVQTFTSTSTWTKPSGSYTMAKVELWGGGGAGSSGGSSAAPGGGGGYSVWIGMLSTLASTVTATVGAGGTVGYTTGGSGGNSSFAIGPVTFSAGGGRADAGDAISYYGGYGTEPGAGVSGSFTPQYVNNAIYAGACNGGTSIFGGNAGTNNGGSGGGTAGAGSAPGGGGGGGGFGSNQGGAGARGQIVVTCW